MDDDSAHGGARRFEGRVALVTGATQGIGLAIAHRLADEGARLAVVSRHAADADAARLLPRGTTTVAGDVADPRTAERAVAAALELGRLDVLVNNAGIDHTGPLADTPPDEVREVFAVNALGPIWMLQAAARAMRARGGGAIVNVSSRLASIGVPAMAVYSASKGALRALTTAAAVELAPHGIRVNAVAPGMTATPLYDAWLEREPDPEAARRASVAGIPQRRLARPQEVAAAVAFLAADEAAHVTGATIAVDGGYTAT